MVERSIFLHEDYDMFDVGKKAFRGCGCASMRRTLAGMSAAAAGATPAPRLKRSDRMRRRVDGTTPAFKLQNRVVVPIAIRQL